MMRAMMNIRLKEKSIQIATFVLLCCLPGHGIMGQMVTVRVLPDTSQALIGDQLGLQLIIEKPGDVSVTFPEIGDNLTDKIVVTGRSDIDTTVISNEREQLAQRLTIAVFDTGRVEVPPLAFRFQSGQISDTIVSLQSSIDILPLQLDEDIRDIKSNENAPLTMMEVLPYLIGFLLIVISIWLIRRYYMKKYGRLQVAMADHNLDPPDVTAIRELERLRNEAPWKQNHIKSYYVRLSEVLRYYVERQFRVPALEQTTSEILLSLGKHSGSKEYLRSLDQVLTMADLVKFAKVIPDSHENEIQIDRAIEYVKRSSAALHGSDKESTDRNRKNTKQLSEDQYSDPAVLQKEPEKAKLKT